MKPQNREVNILAPLINSAAWFDKSDIAISLNHKI